MTDKLMTVAETAPFVRQATKLWTEDDRNAFVDFIAANPDVGDVIPDTGHLRKVRWGRREIGKSASAVGFGSSTFTTMIRCRLICC